MAFIKYMVITELINLPIEIILYLLQFLIHLVIIILIIMIQLH